MARIAAALRLARVGRAHASMVIEARIWIARVVDHAGSAAGVMVARVAGAYERSAHKRAFTAMRFVARVRLAYVFGGARASLVAEPFIAGADGSIARRADIPRCGSLHGFGAHGPLRVCSALAFVEQVAVIAKAHRDMSMSARGPMGFCARIARAAVGSNGGARPGAVVVIAVVAQTDRGARGPRATGLVRAHARIGYADGRDLARWSAIVVRADTDRRAGDDAAVAMVSAVDSGAEVDVPVRAAAENSGSCETQRPSETLPPHTAPPFRPTQSWFTRWLTCRNRGTRAAASST